MSALIQENQPSDKIGGRRDGATPAQRSPRGTLPDLLLLLLFLGDAIASTLGLFAGFWVRFRSGWITFGVEPTREIVLRDYLGLIAVGTVFLLLTFAYLRLYDTGNLLRFRRVSLIIVKGTLFWLCSYLCISLALKFNPPISRIYVALSFFSTMSLLLIWRYIFHKILHVEPVASELRQRILFVGWNREAELLMHAINHDRSHPYEVVGYVPFANDQFAVAPPEALPLVGAYEAIPELLRKPLADVVVLTDVNADVSKIVALANLCELHFVQFKVIPSYFQILASCLALETISGVPILGNSGLPLERPLNRALKRTVDLCGAVVGLVVSFPIVVACAAAVYLESPGPVVFSQERIGRNGRRFRMYKLRSMHLGSDTQDHLNQSTLREDPRVLRIGKFMRRFNLDEIPQFWNVLLGDMSLVGPRPERAFHSTKLSLEIPHYNARYSTKPGMTGWAQVNGLRGDTSLVERVRYDLFYLENWSLILDLQIMFQTFFKRENAY